MFYDTIGLFGEESLLNLQELIPHCTVWID